MIICPFCSKKFMHLTASHLLKRHQLSISDFKVKFHNFQMVSDEKRKQTSLSCKKSKCGRWMKGVKCTEERKAHLSKINSGENNPFFGKRHSNKTKRKMSRNHADFTGQKNPFKKSLSDPFKIEQLRTRAIKHWQKIKQDPKKFLAIKEAFSKATIKAMKKGKCKSYGKGHKHGWSKVQGIKI